MENLNITEILNAGLPGSVFLLSMLSYLLLANEQKKEIHDVRIIGTIKTFMYINIFLAILTGASPVIDRAVSQGILIEEPFTILANKGDNYFGQGKVLVCNNNYNGRYLLITSGNRGKMFQGLANYVPCASEGNEQHIVITENDAQKLGWEASVTEDKVEVAMAPLGLKFDIAQQQN